MRKEIRKALLMVCALVLALSYAGAAAAQSCTPAPSGIVAWWPGDGNANDVIGGSHGSPQNGATFAPAKVAQALSFDGQDDLVVVGNSSAFNFAGRDFTLEFWSKTAVTGGGAYMILSYGDGGNWPGIKWHVFIANGFLVAQISTGLINNSDVTLVSTSTTLDDASHSKAAL